jgi:hypothetical protein
MTRGIFANEKKQASKRVTRNQDVVDVIAISRRPRAVTNNDIV